MPAIVFVRYSVQMNEDSETVDYRSEEGITLREVLTEELGVNPSKHAVMVNGVESSDLDLEVQNGDRIVLTARKYSSCSRPAEGYADADIDTLRSRYLELENRVLANHSTLNRFVLLPYASSSTISVHDRFATLLVSEFMRSAMPAMAMHGHIHTYICLLRSVFRLRTDLMNRRRCSTGCVGDAEPRHCLLDREPSRIRWLDGIVPRHARMHVLLRKAVMPEFCICLLIRKQPTLNIPIFLGYDQAGIPCILTPSTNKVTGLIKKLYGIDDYDRLVPLNVEDSILMTPESSSFPEMFGAWLKKQVNILIAYCGRTDIVPYIKELPERLEDGEQYKNGDGISPDSLFHKFYVY